jgi:AcrR family transcriptional regulator
VAQIAARAGLTERTFFRYFVDKREVFFWGAGAFQAQLIAAVRALPRAATPLEAIEAALRAAASAIGAHGDWGRARHALISANKELEERELIKLAALASAMAAALRKRGVGEPAASLSAEAAIAILKTAYERWACDNGRNELWHHMRESLDELSALTSGERRPAPPQKSPRAPARPRGGASS